MKLPTGIVLALAALGWSAPPATDTEIDRLLQSLKTSGCKFERNGTWYEGAKAVEHLGGKRDYLRKKDKIRTSEDFIRLAATQSSMSGKPYHVACPDKPVVESKAWLTAELSRIRGQQPARPQRP